MQADPLPAAFFAPRSADWVLTLFDVFQVGFCKRHQVDWVQWLVQLWLQFKTQLIWSCSPAGSELAEHNLHSLAIVLGEGGKVPRKRRTRIPVPLTGPNGQLLSRKEQKLERRYLFMLKLSARQL